MIIYEYFLLFPEGECQEIARPVSVSSFVDMNGNSISLPLPTNKMIVYQVAQKRTMQTEPGIIRIFYVLQQLSAMELLDYT